MSHDFEQIELELLTDNDIKSLLAPLGMGDADNKTLAQYILRLSDLYHSQKGSPEVWQDPKLCAAYLVYFMPLILMRNVAVIREAKRVGFFENVKEIIDYGAGPGTFEWAWLQALNLSILFTSVDYSNPLYQSLSQLFARKFQWPRAKRLSPTDDLAVGKNSLVAFSYSLNEMKSIPEKIKIADSLLIIEPSNVETSRRLQQLRGELISQGYSAWGPCLHQDACPLLEHSKKDWCHTRIHVKMPDWFLDIEKYLPMKNASLTYSYLLMKKTPPPANQSLDFRIIGDTLFEKGKTRQAVCRSSQREFLSWLKKEGDAPVIPRGSVIEVQSPLIEKGDELRPADKVFEFKIKT